MQKIRNKIYVIVFLFLCLINFYPQTKQSQDQSTKKHCVVKNTLTQTDSVSKVVYFQTEITIKEDTSHKSFVFIVGILTFVVSGINPFGFGYFELLSSDSLSFFSERTSEYLSVDMHKSFINIIYYMLMLVLLLFFEKKEKIAYIMILIFWQYSGFEFVRHVALFGIMIMLILPQLIDIKFNSKNMLLEKVKTVSDKLIK